MTYDVLGSILSRYPALIRPLAEPEPLGNAGGTSGVSLWRYPSGRGPLVVRAWPPEETEPDRLRRIHGWLSEAAPLGFVPAPVADLSGETVQSASGRLWDVSPWMPGAADPGRPPRTVRLRAGFAAIASFHQALAWRWTTGPSPGLRGRLAEIQALKQGGFDVLDEAVEQIPDDPNRVDARAWLVLARRLAPRSLEAMSRAAARSYTLQPCLRDARPEHLLFEDDRVTGLVDFGAMAVDLVAGDLARLLSEWVEGDRLARAEALDAYASVRPLDQHEAALIALFEESAALLGAGRWVRWHFVERRVFEDPQAVARGLGRGLERLARLGAEASW